MKKLGKNLRLKKIIKPIAIYLTEPACQYVLYYKGEEKFRSSLPFEMISTTEDMNNGFFQIKICTNNKFLEKKEILVIDFK